MVAQGFTVDLNKALVFQFLTKNQWWAIPLIWLPVVGWSLSRSINMGNSILDVVLVVAIGVFLWTLVEYSLHRFLFHIEMKSYWGNTLHYLLHGCHHKHPMDGLRLVFPPAATAILLYPFWNLIKLLSTPTTAPALFAGGLLGYVMYDVTHHYVHHGTKQSNTEKSQEVSFDPSLPHPGQRLRHYFPPLGQGFWNIKSCWEE